MARAASNISAFLQTNSPRGSLSKRGRSSLVIADHGLRLHAPVIWPLQQPVRKASTCNSGGQNKWLGSCRPPDGPSIKPHGSAPPGLSFPATSADVRLDPGPLQQRPLRGTNMLGLTVRANDPALYVALRMAMMSSWDHHRHIDQRRQRQCERADGSDRHHVADEVRVLDVEIGFALLGGDEQPVVIPARCASRLCPTSSLSRTRIIASSRAAEGPEIYLHLDWSGSGRTLHHRSSPH